MGSEIDHIHCINTNIKSGNPPYQSAQRSGPLSHTAMEEQSINRVHSEDQERKPLRKRQNHRTQVEDVEHKRGSATATVTARNQENALPGNVAIVTYI